MEYSPITIRSSSSEDDEKVLAVRTSSEEDEEDEEKDENEAEEEEEVADDDEEDEYEDYKGHEEVLTTTLKGKLKMCLDDIRISGDFAMSAQFNSFPNPGLEVDGSIISLPLTPSDAVKLRAACREAPFGKGDETLVDANVRKTWEWDSSQFHLRNPSWKGFLDDLLRKVVLKLGMSRVRADPYKLLLYENGSFFKRHKDSGKCPGMIGTLVVSLPSEHGGGDVHLSHGGKTRIFPTAPYSSFDLTALAWFSDVTHEIKEVTSGYRLVLTYNLVHIWGEIPSASYYEQQQARLSKILRYVYRKATGVTQLFYLLGYQYTPASLRLEYLKGRDHAVCQALSRACSDQGFWFLLADVTRSLSTDRSGYDYGNSDDNYLEVKVTRDVKGRQISSGDDIDLEDILGFDPYSMRTPDSEDEGEEYTGNESIPPSQRYYDTAAMIIPKRNTAAMFIKAGSHCTNFITMVAEELERQADDPLTRASALRVMNTYLDNGTYLEDKTIALVARWAVTLKDKGLFNKALRTGLSRNSEACILKAIADGINKAFSADESKRPDWDTWLGYLISNPDSLTKLVSMLATVESHLTKAALQEPFAAWRLSALTKAFKSKTHLDTADFEYIKKLVLARRNNLEWIETRIVPKLVSRGSRSLILQFVDFLLQDPQGGGLGPVRSTAKAVLAPTTEKLELVIADFGGSNRSPNTTYYWKEFMRVIQQCFDHELTDVATSLLQKSSVSVGHALKKKDLQSYDIPRKDTVAEFLQSLISVLRTQDAAHLSAAGGLFEAFLEGVLLREFEEEVKDYDRQLRALEEVVRPFRDDLIKDILGDDRYKRLVLLEETSEPERESSANEPEKRTADDEIAPTKRQRTS